MTDKLKSLSIADLKTLIDHINEILNDVTKLTSVEVGKYCDLMVEAATELDNRMKELINPPNKKE